ncbi:MAG: GyrI-like domain-containing protein [Treponema sp.]|nr:GyrI-like domain-containing protein [Treponema sp.]
MEPKMVKKTDVKLAGFVLKTNNNGENKKAIPKFWQEYISSGKMRKLHGETFIKNHAEYGVCFITNSETGDMEYVIGIEVKDGANVPAGYHTCTIPEALYAVFSTPPSDTAAFTAAIQGTWNFIYSEWFPKSGYEFDGMKCDYEFYDERDTGEKGNVCEIYIPVVKKET